MWARYFILVALCCYVFYRSVIVINVHRMFDSRERGSCESSSLFSQLVSTYRRCLLGRLSKTGLDIWSELEATIHSCIDRKTRRWRMLNVRVLRNKDDKKFVILPHSSTAPCLQISLGIGDDITAELALHQLLPSCTHIGVDPVLESGQVYRSIGEYYQLAVSAQSGVSKALVLTNGSYHFEQVNTVSLEEFLSEYAKSNTIDYLWIDNEGAEYRMFKKYVLTKTSFTVCQISVEMHSPFHQYGINGTFYNSMIIAILNGSNFLPVWSEVYGQHTRAFYINTGNKWCLEKYSVYGYCE